MGMIEEVAKALRVFSRRLNAPYPFHCPAVMQTVRAEFAARMRNLVPRTMQTPVFSPILGRFYGAEDALTECLAEHLVRPVLFSRAVQQLDAEGVCVFVESGALDTLGKLVKNVLKRPDVTTIACLDPKQGGARSLENALLALRAMGLLPPRPAESLCAWLLPGVAPEDFDAFWREQGPRILSDIRKDFAGFEAQRMRPAAALISVPEAPVPQLVFDAPPSAPDPAPAMIRAELFQALASMFAEALEYPEEVFTEEVELEAELGIDSVKQTELLARVSERYSLPPRPADFRLSDYHTMGRVTDYVYSGLTQTTTVPAPDGPGNEAALMGVATASAFATAMASNGTGVK